MSTDEAAAPAVPPVASHHPCTRWIAEALVVVVGASLLLWAWRADRSWYERHMTWTSCVCEPEHFLGFTKYRWMVGILGALVVLVARPLVGRRAARGPTAEFFGTTARLGSAAVMSVLAADIILRIKEPPMKPIGLDLPMAVKDADIGWRPDPSKKVIFPYGERRIEYVTDAAGVRVKSVDEPTDFAKPAILFAGESITLGLGLPYDATYVALASKRTGIHGVNLGVTAYSNDQAYAWLKEELPRFEKPIAVVTLLVHAQLIRNVDRRFGHRIPDDDGTTTVVRASSQFFLQSPVRDLVERRIGYHSSDHLQIARAVIRATARDARARGAYPLFVLTNWGKACLPADDGGPPPLDHELFGGLDVPFIRVDLDAAWWDATIDHPGALAHEALAARIVQTLGEAGVVRPLSEAATSEEPDAGTSPDAARP